MDHPLILTVAAAALIGTGAPCYAGPCTAEVAQVEKNIRQAQATAQPGGAGEPSAPQSIGAQLHRQPTPGSVEVAERKARADAAAALDRARAADANGDAAACAKALGEARDIYGL
jgi:hypothetical protein